eukprot:364041-Chlamydomonas_euryale.AAC.9
MMVMQAGCQPAALRGSFGAVPTTPGHILEPNHSPPTFVWNRQKDERVFESFTQRTPWRLGCIKIFRAAFLLWCTKVWAVSFRHKCPRGWHAAGLSLGQARFTNFGFTVFPLFFRECLTKGAGKDAEPGGHTIFN